MKEIKKIAHIIKTHGLSGELTIFLLTDHIDLRFKKGAKIIIDNQEYKVKRLSDIKDNKANLLLDGYNHISQVENLVKKDIYADKLNDESIVYLDDLIGFDVVLPSLEVVGKVESYQNFGVNKYIIVNSKYIPLIEKVFYSLIDVEAKKIYLTKQGEDCYYNA